MKHRDFIEPPKKIAEVDDRTAARIRYQQSLTSNIFSSSADSKGVSTAPPGKRRDQTHSELFPPSAATQADSRCLKKTSDTFVPREPLFSARERRDLEFFGKEQMSTATPSSIPSAPACYPLNKMDDPQERRLGTAPRVHDEEIFHAEKVRPNAEIEKEAINVRALRQQRGNDIFHSGKEEDFSNCSGQSSRRHDSQSDLDKHMRKHNQHYSNIFHRDTSNISVANAVIDADASYRRAKPQSDIDPNCNRVWIDAKTELSRKENRFTCGEDAEGSDNVYMRTMREKYVSHLPNLTQQDNLDDLLKKNRNEKNKTTVSHKKYEYTNAYDNSMKSSMINNDYYNSLREEKNQNYDLIAISLNNIGTSMQQDDIKHLASSYNCHISKLSMEKNPITHSHKGKARLLIREKRGEKSYEDFARRLKEMGCQVVVDQPTDIAF